MQYSIRQTTCYETMWIHMRWTGARVKQIYTIFNLFTNHINTKYESPPPSFFITPSATLPPPIFKYIICFAYVHRMHCVTVGRRLLLWYETNAYCNAKHCAYFFDSLPRLTSHSFHFSPFLLRDGERFSCLQWLSHCHLTVLEMNSFKRVFGLDDG